MAHLVPTMDLLQPNLTATMRTGDPALSADASAHRLSFLCSTQYLLKSRGIGNNWAIWGHCQATSQTLDECNPQDPFLIQDFQYFESQLY